VLAHDSNYLFEQKNITSFVSFMATMTVITLASAIT